MDTQDNFDILEQEAFDDIIANNHTASIVCTLLFGKILHTHFSCLLLIIVSVILVNQF